MRIRYELTRDLATIPGFCAQLPGRPVHVDALAAVRAFCARCGWELVSWDDTHDGIAVLLDSDGAYAGPSVAAAWRDCLAQHGVKGRDAQRLR